MAEPDDMEEKQKFDISSLFLSEDDDPEWDAAIEHELQELMQDPKTQEILARIAGKTDPIPPLRTEQPPHISLWRLREIALRPKASIDRNEHEHFQSCDFCKANRVRMMAELWHPDFQTLRLYHSRQMGEADFEQIEAHLDVSRCERCRMVEALLTCIDKFFDQDPDVQRRAAPCSLEYLKAIEAITIMTPEQAQEFGQVSEYLRIKQEEVLNNPPKEVPHWGQPADTSHKAEKWKRPSASERAYEAMDGAHQFLIDV
jgi:hypothetical protein